MNDDFREASALTAAVVLERLNFAESAAGATAEWDRLRVAPRANAHLGAPESPWVFEDGTAAREAIVEAEAELQALEFEFGCDVELRFDRGKRAIPGSLVRVLITPAEGGNPLPVRQRTYFAGQPCPDCAAPLKVLDVRPGRSPEVRPGYEVQSATFRCAGPDPHCWSSAVSFQAGGGWPPTALRRDPCVD